MRIKVTYQNVYTIKELKESYPSGLEKAYHEYAYTGLWHDWYDFVYDDAKEYAKLLGISIDKIYFSGFSSQGDGACFEGDYAYRKQSYKDIKDYAPQDTQLHEIARGLQSIQKRNFYGLSAYVKHSEHYYHKMCTDIRVMSDNESMEGVNDEAYYGIQELLRDFMEWIYRRLEKEYGYIISEKYFIEISQASEWEYTQTGELV